MAVTKTVITQVVTRDWNEIEPKVLTFLATGLTGGIVIQWASYVGWHPTPALASVIVTLIASVAGYIKKSTTKVAVPAGQLTPAPVSDPSAPVA